MTFEGVQPLVSLRGHAVLPLAQAKSIREIFGGLACCVGKIRHLGLQDFPRKSNLAYANAHRPWEMYQDLFYHLLDRYQET